MPRAFVSSAYVVAVLSAIVAFSTGRDAKRSASVSINSHREVRLIDSMDPVLAAADVDVPSAATHFACGDLADRIDQIADELDSLDCARQAASLRGVSHELRHDLRPIAPSSAAAESFVSGGVRLSR